MQVAQQANRVKPAREAAVAATIERIRQAEQAQGVSRPALEAIQGLLLELAAQRELFPAEDFPVNVDGRGQNAIYLLAEDADKRFALYMSTSQGAKKVPPHNHTTWAVIVGVNGDERNVFYERSDDGSTPGAGTLRQIREQTVRPGSGVAMMPEDIHHIETHGDTHSLHLHMYGLALDQLHERVRYDVEQGTYQIFPATQNIQDAR